MQLTPIEISQAYLKLVGKPMPKNLTFVQAQVKLSKQFGNRRIAEVLGKQLAEA